MLFPSTLYVRFKIEGFRATKLRVFLGASQVLTRELKPDDEDAEEDA